MLRNSSCPGDGVRCVNASSTSLSKYEDLIDVVEWENEIPEEEDVDRLITFRRLLIAPDMLRADDEAPQEQGEEDLLLLNENRALPNEVQRLISGNISTNSYYNEIGKLLSVPIRPIDEHISAELELKDRHVKQYAHSVLDFSSQYGIDLSISYTAPNITGPPTIYPECGDFPQTFAMRTYGRWWNSAPSRREEIQAQNISSVAAEDFIVLYFEEYVIPEEISIFETFNPGAIVRIWSYTIAQTWVCLWEDTEFHRVDRAAVNRLRNQSRRFQPKIKQTNLPSKIIRLEFNHERLHYYTEIDAVQMIGRKLHFMNMRYLLSYYDRLQKQQEHQRMLQQNQQLQSPNNPIQATVKGSKILSKLQKMHFHPLVVDQNNYQACLRKFLLHDLDNFLVSASEQEQHQELTSIGDNIELMKVTNQPQKGTVGLKDMPFDVMLKICSYLDLASLFRMGRVSRFCYHVSTHPSLYTEVNLRPYWNVTDNELLSTLAKRATNLRKLDLSWCGCTVQAISPTEFKKFIQQRGDNLSHLRLNSSKFLNPSCIETLGIVCDNLKELSLRNCSTSHPLLNFSCLANLKNLERLDLFQTMVESDLLLTMLENNSKLKHLNIAFCNVAVNMDEVAYHISNHNHELVSLDMWKSHFLSASGLRALSNCHMLEEVDLGWCLREAALGDSLQEFLQNCPRLKKLFLAAVRGLTDRDLEFIANLCPNLEQLDLMGVLSISKERYVDILQRCPKLELLDLSFCDNVMDYDVEFWSNAFDVDIKYCHLPNDYR